MDRMVECLQNKAMAISPVGLTELLSDQLLRPDLESYIPTHSRIQALVLDSYRKDAS
jgi:hypothetical protein